LKQSPLKQSVSPVHALPDWQRVQVPPQSMSLSLPFFTPSLQRAG